MRGGGGLAWSHGGVHMECGGGYSNIRRRKLHVIYTEAYPYMF